MMAKYKLIIYWSEEYQAYIAEVPELAGCMADGSSYQEAVNNAERVIAEWTETAVELGRSVPEPKGGYMLGLYRHCCSFARKHPLVVVIGIMLVVFSFYFAKFHNGFSDTNGDWGTFGDYVGGILNPVIASFAFYLIAKTYELQETELKETRKLLKVSTDAQNKQVKLAVLTALFNSNLTRIDLLESQKIPWLGIHERGLSQGSSPELEAQIDNAINRIEVEMKVLKNESIIFEEQIKAFLKEETE